MYLFCSILCIHAICLLLFVFMYMFVPLYIFVNIVFVLMGRYGLLDLKKKNFLSCSVRRDENISSDIVKDIHLLNWAIHIV